jgi:hypothetical protein
MLITLSVGMGQVMEDLKAMNKIQEAERRVTAERIVKLLEVCQDLVDNKYDSGGGGEYKLTRCDCMYPEDFESGWDRCEFHAALQDLEVLLRKIKEDLP